MYTYIIITGLLSIIISYKFLMLPWVKKRRKTAITLPENFTPMVQQVAVQDIWKSITPSVNNNTGFDEVWWKALVNSDQLQMALMLAQKALPVWESYVDSHDIVYQHSPSVPVSRIDHQLLAKAIDELMRQSKQIFPGSNNAKIKQYYYFFVGPVIALQDGNWMPPYPIKKIFLSVYNILKSIVEQDNVSAIEIFLAIAINQSLDCLDITKLYRVCSTTQPVKISAKNAV